LSRGIFSLLLFATLQGAATMQHIYPCFIYNEFYHLFDYSPTPPRFEGGLGKILPGVIELCLVVVVCSK